MPPMTTGPEYTTPVAPSASTRTSWPAYDGIVGAGLSAAAVVAVAASDVVAVAGSTAVGASAPVAVGSAVTASVTIGSTASGAVVTISAVVSSTGSATIGSPLRSVAPGSVGAGSVPAGSAPVASPLGSPTGSVGAGSVGAGSAGAGSVTAGSVGAGSLGAGSDGSDGVGSSAGAGSGAGSGSGVGSLAAPVSPSLLTGSELSSAGAVASSSVAGTGPRRVSPAMTKRPPPPPRLGRCRSATGAAVSTADDARSFLEDDNPGRKPSTSATTTSIVPMLAESRSSTLDGATAAELGATLPRVAWTTGGQIWPSPAPLSSQMQRIR